MTTTKQGLAVHAIPPRRLAAVRTTGQDGHGNLVTAYPATGGEPLRCCLTCAPAGEAIALMSYAPFEHASPWREVGPVYIHAEACGGYPTGAGLPGQLRRGPRLLRTYRSDDTMNYAHNTLVEAGEDIEARLDHLLSLADVATVHVRTVLPQCFLFAVTTTQGPGPGAHDAAGWPRSTGTTLQRAGAGTTSAR